MLDARPSQSALSAHGATFPRHLGLLLTLALALAACSAPPTSEPAPTETQFPAAPTAAPTSVVPTVTAAITANPKPQLGPELPVTSIDQVAGNWSVRIKEFTASDSPKGTAGVLTLASDGPFICHYTEGWLEGASAWDGPYRFEGDVLVLDNETCLTHLGDAFPCTATYHVFVAMAGDTPGSLRFVAIEDPWEGRNRSLTAGPFYPAEP